MQALYTTSAIASGGRDGRAVAGDQLDVKLTMPKELGGAGGTGTNPEQLFAAGYAACFLSALKLVAGNNRSSLPSDTTVTAEVGIGPNGGGGFGLAVSLRVVAPGMERTAAEALVAKAHQVCPYSNATRGNLDVKLVVA